MALLLLAVALLASAAAQPVTTETRTCADKAAAGLTEPCIVPYAFPANATVSGFRLPTAWQGPAPICYTQYYQARGAGARCVRCLTLVPTEPAGDAHFHACRLVLLRVWEPGLLQQRDGQDVRGGFGRCVTQPLTRRSSIDDGSYGTVFPYPGYSSRRVLRSRAPCGGAAALAQAAASPAC